MKKKTPTTKKSPPSNLSFKNNDLIGTQPIEDFFTSYDGARLWFSDSGGEGEALFFVYGLGCSIVHWKYPRKHFSQNGSVPKRQIYLDLRGHGRSPPPGKNQRFSAQMIAKDIACLCEQRGIKQATFLGQSMGGSLVLELAKLRPDLVKKIVLLGSPSRVPTYGFRLKPWSNLLWKSLIAINEHIPQSFALVNRVALQTAKYEPLKSIIREVIRKGGFNGELARTDDIEEYISKFLTVDPTTFFQMAAELNQFDIADFGAEINMPTLVIAGANDLVISAEEQKRFEVYMPNVKMEIIPHGSHCPHFDDPNLINNLLEKFINS